CVEHHTLARRTDWLDSARIFQLGPDRVDSNCPTDSPAFPSQQGRLSPVNTFVTSASVAGPRDGVRRGDIPDFAFAGRANVGKSSLLNALMRQKLARTSAAAGKTRQSNIFQMTVTGGVGPPGAWRAYLGGPAGQG